MACKKSIQECVAEASGPPSTIFPVPNTTMPPSPQSVADKLVSLFECTVCRDYALPPIYQCENGHIACEPCLLRLTRCAICDEPVARKIRNRAMEKLAWHVSFPCKYELFGCPEKLSPVEKLEHDQVCDFGLCPCILGLDSCAWQGSLHEVVAHIDKKHSFVPRFQGERIVICAGGFNRPEPFGWVALQSCFGHDFVVQMRKYQHGLAPLQHRFFAALQLVGSRREALKFSWRFELRNRYQRLALDARALSVHDSIQPMQSGNGVIIEMDTVKVFADGSNLNIGVSVFSRTLS
ncbi:E3 ubiquitin-protein ligase SIAH1A-like [Amblyomma americanum]